MLGRLVSAATLVGLAACAPATEETAQEGMRTPELPVAAESSTHSTAPRTANLLPASELAGEYRIAGVDGGDIDQPYAITASVDAGRIHVVADCVNMAWRYTYADGRLATTRVPTESCARGLTAKEEAVVTAIDRATRATRTPANGIELSGGGHRVTLFSQ